MYVMMIVCVCGAVACADGTHAMRAPAHGVRGPAHAMRSIPAAVHGSSAHTAHARGDAPALGQPVLARLQ